MEKIFQNYVRKSLRACLISFKKKRKCQNGHFLFFLKDIRQALTSGYEMQFTKMQSIIMQSSNEQFSKVQSI